MTTSTLAALSSGADFDEASRIRLCDFVRRWTGVSIDAEKAYLIQGRMRPLLQKQNIPSLSVAMDLCERGNHALRETIIDSMTTHETLFFRDIHPFETLVQRILPKMLDERPASQSVQIHCAACSTGQEPYSIAIRLKESLGDASLRRIKIDASDVSRGTIEAARQGEYLDHELRRGLNATQLQRFFTPSSADDMPRRRIADEIRSRVCFNVLNLTQLNQNAAMRSTVDVCLCRNVLIYFDPPTRDLALQGLAHIVKPGGILILGSSEMLRDRSGSFQSETIGSTAIHRRQ